MPPCAAATFLCAAMFSNARHSMRVSASMRSHLMIAIRPVLALLSATLLVSGAVAPTSAQGSLVTGRADPNATGAQAQYMAYMSASVDTVVMAWQRAMKARDADALSVLYTDDAILALSSGRLVRGRGSVRDAYERMLPRLHAARMDVVQIIASADVASVVATLDCEIRLPSGGWYHRELPILLTIKAEDRGRFRIAIQSGGDMQFLSVARPRSGAPGAKSDDSLAVVLTDASGLGVPGVLVSFLVEHGAGAVDPVVAVTDANGHAASLLNASAAAEPSVVRAAAATLLEEPVFFTAMGGAGTDSTNAHSAMPRHQ